MNEDQTAEAAGIFDRNPLYLVHPENSFFSIRENLEKNFYIEVPSDSTVVQLKEAISHRRSYLTPKMIHLYDDNDLTVQYQDRDQF